MTAPDPPRPSAASPRRRLPGEGFAETQEILADSALMAAIRRGLRDAGEGHLFTTDEVRATLGAHGAASAFRRLAARSAFQHSKHSTRSIKENP